jgi:hypothetical protein
MLRKARLFSSFTLFFSVFLREEVTALDDVAIEMGRFNEGVVDPG